MKSLVALFLSSCSLFVLSILAFCSSSSLIFISRSFSLASAILFCSWVLFSSSRHCFSNISFSCSLFAIVSAFFAMFLCRICILSVCSFNPVLTWPNLAALAVLSSSWSSSSLTTSSLFCCSTCLMAKYETMKAKLDATKGSLDAKQKQITNQAALTEKITAMKERVEQYAAKKEAVSALTEHVAIRQVLQQNKLDVVNEELDQEDDNTANAARLGQVKTGLKEHTERMQILQRNMQKNAETMAKREQLKEMLEKQCLLEEKRTQ